MSYKNNKRKHSRPVFKYKLNILFVSIFVIFGIGCDANDSSTSSGDELSVDVEKTSFSMNSAMLSLPDDVRREVSFFAGGGGGGCGEFEGVTVEPSDREVTVGHHLYIRVCGWEASEPIISLRVPDGTERIIEPAEIYRNDYGVRTVVLSYYPMLTDPLGQYQIVFSDYQNGQDTMNFTVIPAAEPQLIWYQDDAIINISGFRAYERVRLLAYEFQSSPYSNILAGWQEYTVDSNGNLIISLDDGTNNFYSGYAVVGDNSGEAVTYSSKNNGLFFSPLFAEYYSANQ